MNNHASKSQRQALKFISALFAATDDTTPLPLVAGDNTYSVTDAQFK